jgi:type I restriction enzyme, S subunit
MKKGWERKRLDEACHFTNGLWKGEKPPLLTVGVIRNTNFTKDGMLDDTDIAYIDVEAKKFKNRRLQYGDIILEKSGGGPKQPVGRVALFDKEEGDFSFSNFTAALRVKDTTKLDFRYLHKCLFWLYQSGVTEGMQSHSTGIRNLDGDAYKAIQIPIPPLSEQHRIVGLLDEAFAGLATAKANAEKNLQNARALFESHLQSVFADQWQTGELITLTDLATDITDGDHLPPPKSPTGVPFITIGNIVKETRTIDFSDTFMVPRAYYDALKPYKKPRQGDVLFTVTGSFGIPVIVRDDTEFCFQRHIGLVRPKPETNSSWLYYLLMSPQLFKQANDGATGTAQKTVSLKLLRSFVVPKVSPKQQKQAVEKFDALVDETQRLADLYSRKCAALEALKKSLLHQAFSGEL